MRFWVEITGSGTTFDSGSVLPFGTVHKVYFGGIIWYHLYLYIQYVDVCSVCIFFVDSSVQLHMFASNVCFALPSCSRCHVISSRNWALQKHCFWIGESRSTICFLEFYWCFFYRHVKFKMKKFRKTNPVFIKKTPPENLENSTWNAHLPGSSCWHWRGLVHSWVDWNRWVSGWYTGTELPVSLVILIGNFHPTSLDA